MERNYYQINEELAKQAHEMMSFSDYKMGRLTAEYKAKCDKIYDLADRLAKERPEEAEHGYRLADRYARKMAENFNHDSAIGTRCPSVMIAGPANFPTRKKEKQVAAWDSNMRERQEIEKIYDKLWSIINGKNIINSDDENVIEKLEKRIADKKNMQEHMKNVNAYYRKHKTLDGCPDLTTEQIAKMTEEMKNDWRENPKPYESFYLTNNNAEIHRLEKRLKDLKAMKETETSETEDESGLYKLIENTEIARIQFEFDGKPDENIRSILKSNGFRWAPSQGRWQRQLTANGKYAAQKVVKALKELKA